MNKLVEELDSLAKIKVFKEWTSPEWKLYVLTGDEAHLKSLPRFTGKCLPASLIESLSPDPLALDDSGKRFLRACVFTGQPQALGLWLRDCLAQPTADSNWFAEFLKIARDTGCSEAEIAEQIAYHGGEFVEKDGSANPRGQYLLSLDSKTISRVFSSLKGNLTSVIAMSELFAKHAPEPWKKLLEVLVEINATRSFDPIIWITPFKISPKHFVDITAKAFSNSMGWYSRFSIGEALYAWDAARFGATMRALTSTQLLAIDDVSHHLLWAQSKDAADWLVAHEAQWAMPELTKYMGAPLSQDEWVGRNQESYKTEFLDVAGQTLGRQAIPLFEACFATAQSEVQMQALQLWVSVKEPGETGVIATKLKPLLSTENTSTLTRAVRLAGELGADLVESDLWPLLSHKSKPVREAAANTLAKLGENRLCKAAELWQARKADTRMAAVTWLRALETPAAIAELKSRLDVEEDDNVRDSILLALEQTSGVTETTVTEGTRERIKKALKKAEGSPIAWLDIKKLPLPNLKDGTKMPLDWLRYLLYRQSRIKEMRGDIEARAIYQQIDRTTSGDLALAVVQAFFGSNADADDRWAMAFAAVVGNDRLVPVFSRQIRDWADNMRGKLAEYAVQALALLGSDTALLTVDALAIRYRSKNKNIGKAASEAFAGAARNRGVTVEELGDLVVPWLGFEPGKPRILETPKTTIEVRLGSDFKLGFRDAATKKKIAKLPDSADDGIKAEFKEISAALKEATKSQLLRMETLMVRQFRWPAAKWSELYLRHPLLLPFAQRLVWGVYIDGKLFATFRALEDTSLTDANDEPLNLSSDGEVGIIHPLELSAEERQNWLRHMADYDVVPPFAQLERSVVRVKSDQVLMKFGLDFDNTEINAMTFKGRAERLGWTRGSVCDAGGISFYLKVFPAAGVDVFVETEGMFVGIDMYSDITLGKIFFVKHGSVTLGSYEYDEPQNEKDPRLVAFGDVPLIAFSEAMGNLSRIAAKSNAE